LLKGDPVQTTLLGLAIAFILALLAALIGPYFVDWNQFRPQFEAEAGQVLGAPVRVAGQLDARLLPTPTLRLRQVTIGSANDLGKLRADKLDVEFSLGDLMRGAWRANELTVNGLSMDLGLDPQGRIDLPVLNGRLNLASLSVDRLNLTGRIALHDAASRSTLELSDIAFSGDVRALAGAVRGDGNFMVAGTRYPFRLSSGQTQDGSGTRVHLNIDPGERPLSAEFDGVLSFDTRTPRFDGMAVLASPAASKQAALVSTPWKVSARVKGDPAGARLEQLEASFGPEDSTLKSSGAAEIRFGAAPLLRAVLSARQLDADRFAASGEPIRLLPAVRAFMAALPAAPLPTSVEFSAEQIMLGGRPLQNLSAELHADANSWTIRQLDVGAPGATHVVLTSAAVRPDRPDAFNGKLDIESSDPDTLVGWMQGRSEVVSRSQKPFKLRGDVNVTANRVSIDGLKADIDGGAVEGRVSFAHRAGGGRSLVDAAFKADRLDLDAATAFARAIAGPTGDWPDEATVALDIGRAISAGQELHPFSATFGYSPTTLSLPQLKFGQGSGVTMEASANFDRVDATGKMTLETGAASIGQITAILAPFAPAVAARLGAAGTAPGPARVKISLDLDKGAPHSGLANARAVVNLDAPQLKGAATLTAKPEASALKGIDLDRLRRSEFVLDAKLSSERTAALLGLLGLDRAVAAGEGPAQFEGALSGAWRAPLQVKARFSGAGLDADVQGTAEPSAAEPKAGVNLKVRSVNLAPLFGLKPSEALTSNLSLSSRVSLAGNRLTFDDLDSSTAGSRLRGHLALTLDEERTVEGEVGLDSIELAPAWSLAIGAAGRDAAEPLGTGLLKGWHGRVAFQALRGVLPGGGELRPVSGVLKGDGGSLAIDAVKAGIGGGEANASFDARTNTGGVSLNASLQLANVDATALRWRGLAMPKGRAALQMTLMSQGRSASALLGDLSGSGAVTLEAAEIGGLNPRVFDVAIRAGDLGQVTDDAKLRQIVEPALASGSLSVPSAQIPFTIRDGRLRVGATTLEGKGARAIVSGGYDIPADQADLRASLASASTGSASNGPEIQLYLAGPPDGLNRTVDVTGLSSWLAVRAIDRETRRLDAIERGEPPPPATAALPLPASPEAVLPVPPPHLPPKAKAAPPRVLTTPPAPPAAAPPALSQQAAPLPPPIEVRPAPGPPPAPAPVRPKPRPPLVLTPPGNP
jgi:large subunit ribosomal protein L24